MSEQLSVINSYFELVQAFNTEPEAYAAILHPDVEQTEYPNSIYKTVQRRSFTDILDNLRAGRELLRDQHFEVEHMQANPDGSVVVEGLWQATTASDVGALLRGQLIRGQLCLVFEFKDGKIYRQRRYPCYYMS